MVPASGRAHRLCGARPGSVLAPPPPPVHPLDRRSRWRHRRVRVEPLALPARADAGPRPLLHVGPLRAHGPRGPRPPQLHRLHQPAFRSLAAAAGPDRDLQCPLPRPGRPERLRDVPPGAPCQRQRGGCLVGGRAVRLLSVSDGPGHGPLQPRGRSSAPRVPAAVEEAEGDPSSPLRRRRRADPGLGPLLRSLLRGLLCADRRREPGIHDVARHPGSGRPTAPGRPSRPGRPPAPPHRAGGLERGCRRNAPALRRAPDWALGEHPDAADRADPGPPPHPQPLAAVAPRARPPLPHLGLARCGGRHDRQRRPPSLPPRGGDTDRRRRVRLPPHLLAQ